MKWIFCKMYNLKIDFDSIDKQMCCDSLHFECRNPSLSQFGLLISSKCQMFEFECSALMSHLNMYRISFELHDKEIYAQYSFNHVTFQSIFSFIFSIYDSNKSIDSRYHTEFQCIASETCLNTFFFHFTFFL